MSKLPSFDIKKAPNQLAKEIIDMANKDQGARFSGFEQEQIKEIDIANTKRMAKIVDENGWPTIELIGEEASEAAWLLVQHADLNPEFQEKALERMKTLSKEQVSQKNIAYLEDRVRVGKKKPTLYGTQFYRRDDGKLVLREIEDPDNVDERRRSMGLESLEEYKDFFYSKCAMDAIDQEPVMEKPQPPKEK